MKITLTLRRRQGLVADNTTKFLLSDTSVDSKVGLADELFCTFHGVKGAWAGTLVVKLRPNDLPAGVPATQVDLTYTVTPSHGGAKIIALKTAQRLLATAPTPSEPPDYRFALGGWSEAMSVRIRTGLRV